ncbi:MAG TPA: aspartate-semialdehyde dehydrogenase, partial [bacterium]
MNSGYHVAVVGATGAVGQEMLNVLQRRRFPVAKITALASARSVGKTVTFGETAVPVQEL